jgi:hypothetical protein
VYTEDCVRLEPGDRRHVRSDAVALQLICPVYNDESQEPPCED